MSFLHWLTEQSLSIIQTASYPGIALISFLENVFTPIPSEAVIPFAGILVSRSVLDLWLVILAATIGSVLGALVFYYLGYIFGSNKVREWIVRWGRYLKITEEDLERAEIWFEKYDKWAVLICRVIPLVRSFISIPAGYVKMPLTQFLILTAVGTSIWSSFLVVLGVVFGEAYEQIVPYFRILDVVFAVAVLGLVVYYVFRRKSAI